MVDLSNTNFDMHRQRWMTANSTNNSAAPYAYHSATHEPTPPVTEASRYDLPVSAMEYEIIDAVRSHDCTILCGETGSGKSTQVPQFLYEAGFNMCGTGDNSSDGLLIGITQPRRVAAISTAKRVSYEMGFGNGQSIPPSNLVAYQTRYKTPGLGGGGGSSTRVKFMMDGILLQDPNRICCGCD